jgi:hypothetical protein
MSLKLLERAVLTEDLPGDGLCAGDLGVVVEHYDANGETPEGCELEFVSAKGDTIAVVSVPSSAVRGVRDREILAVRELGPR